MSANQLSKAALRRRVRNAGCEMRNSRGPINFNNWGQYMLVDLELNAVLIGPNFDATAADISAYLS